ncbi:nitric oxide reductase activation protein NorD [Noviherbaspirillum aridicola]|uniref:Protein norD n=1 Tax=Noviherbaspirillum aridicola TaxID=2849687 RepID=A0ABQ4QAI8_9BURK|nr:VWA domain-containing protein [Noviherbaspirillum aridicola]GIZ53902.1 protein norD [Noviherbaspirillum aridicola]
MPEAEEVISDVAKHATVYVQELWRRHRKDSAVDDRIYLKDVAQRLDLLITAAFGRSHALKVAQPPAPATFLTKVFRRKEGPRVQAAIPATDGESIWLPGSLSGPHALERYRILALQQAARARRGSAGYIVNATSPLHQAIYLVLEAHAADKLLVELLPGTRTGLDTLSAEVLTCRPPLRDFPAYRRPLEEFVRSLLTQSSAHPVPDSPSATLDLSLGLSEELARRSPGLGKQSRLLFKDLWTGELYPAQATSVSMSASSSSDDTEPNASPPRSATLSRRPEVRDACDDEDDKKQGAWMVQTSQPHEQAEDPIGMQRPTDRDESTAAEEFADSLSELPEARLVSTPGRPKEVLLSEDAPVPRVRQQSGQAAEAESKLRYPEWDYRIGAYHEAGATVRLLPPVEGPQEWVDRTLNEYRGMLQVVRRRFEMLRAQRVRMRKQLEGEEIDLQAYIDSYSDFKAGMPMAQALYQTYRPAKRDMAIVLLIDISGSTDGWVSANKRIVDVEREALLLVSIALQGLGEPYSVMAFSGEGPHGVTVRAVKSFEESHNNDVAQRIAALEPEHYTRAGAAIRHATAVLMRQPARHRLLLLLSDGKPNDVDEYEGRYGVEDMRQAVTEARLQGMNSFCLTIDRQAASYLPAVFGAHQYALLPRPDLLPTVLLEWMKRLVAA